MHPALCTPCSRCRLVRAAAAKPDAAVSTSPSAKEVAMKYYQCYNDKNMAGVLDLIDENCIYQDLVYQDPFVGRPAIAAYFDKIDRLVPPDIKFVVEDITDGDPRKVGVRWHVELDGVAEFPFSRGVSFYETNDAGQIVFARDIVEPTIKPGAAALSAISLLAPLVRRLGPAANPANLSKLPLASWAMYGFWGGYVAYVLLSTLPPGLPAWQTTPDALQQVISLSYNFFYVNIGLAEVGLNPVPCVADHPVNEALFNFVNAWSLLFLPTWLADPKGRRVGAKLPLWAGTFFLTNVFALLYMAQRLATGAAGEGEQPSGADAGKGAGAPALPAWAPAIGAVALGVGCFSLYWAAAARPEYGGLAERWAYFVERYSTDRVFWAFCLDAGLYSVWQAWLLGDAGATAWQRFVPFFGLAGWLLQGPAQQQQPSGK